MSESLRGTKKVGIDLADVARFRRFNGHVAHPFLKRVFFESEIRHCFAYTSPAPHLAGIFAAKEAASKALGASRFPFAELEVRHAKDGTPEVWRNGRRVLVSVSISHTASLAAAVAIR